MPHTHTHGQQLWGIICYNKRRQSRTGVHYVSIYTWYYSPCTNTHSVGQFIRPVIVCLWLISLFLFLLKWHCCWFYKLFLSLSQVGFEKSCVNKDNHSILLPLWTNCTYTHVHTCLHSEEEERNLFILGPLMSLCVFLLTQRPVHGEQTCHEGISAITRRRYWYRCINRQTDSRYAPINPSLQNEVSVLTNVKANEGT